MTGTSRSEGLVGQRLSRNFDVDPAVDPRLARRLGPPDRYSFYEHMFTEDVAWLLPADRGGDPSFTARLDTRQEWARDVVLGSLPSQYYSPPSSLRSGLREFARGAATRLVRGPVILETEFFVDGAGNSLPDFRLHFLQEDTFGRVRGKPVQYVPRAFGERTYLGLSYTELNANTLVRIELDPRLRRAVRRALKAFKLADKQQFLPSDILMKGGKSATNFDITLHQTILSSVILAQTREIGWSGRTLLLDDALDPYRAWRHLQFLKFQLKVRKAIFSGLQEAIDKVGARNGFQVTLVVDGLLDEERILHAEKDLRSGAASIASFLNM